jgi:transcriptional regulator with XRE-family HTH domain
MHNIHAPHSHGMAISDDERAFFIALGQRIAAQRKAQGITQVELAERLGISQQAMNSFEKGRRRVPVSLLPVIAQTLQTTLDALVVDDAAPTPTAAPKKRGPQKKIRQQLELIESLPVAEQRAIARVLDSVLAAHQ